VTRKQLLLSVIAAAVVVVAIAVALLLPMYTCMDPYEFEDIQGPGAGPTCIVSDTGYTPDNWVPTKVTVGAAGVVVAVAMVLWSRRRRLLTVGLVVAFIALATAWFLLDV
jgi:hypothetical protein